MIARMPFFNVAFWTNLAIAVVLSIPAVIAIASVQHIMRIPPGYETATRWLFAGTVLAFLLNQVKSPFGVSCFSLNRLDLANMVLVGETLARVGLVAFLFPRLRAPGLSLSGLPFWPAQSFPPPGQSGYGRC